MSLEEVMTKFIGSEGMQNLARQLRTESALGLIGIRDADFPPTATSEPFIFLQKQPVQKRPSVEKEFDKKF